MAAEKGDGHGTTPPLRDPLAWSRPGEAESCCSRTAERPFLTANQGSRSIASPGEADPLFPLQPQGHHQSPFRATRRARTSNGRGARATTFKPGESTAPVLARGSEGGDGGEARARV